MDFNFYINLSMILSAVFGFISILLSFLTLIKNKDIFKKLFYSFLSLGIMLLVQLTYNYIELFYGNVDSMIDNIPFLLKVNYLVFILVLIISIISIFLSVRKQKKKNI